MIATHLFYILSCLARRKQAYLRYTFLRFSPANVVISLLARWWVERFLISCCFILLSSDLNCSELLSGNTVYIILAAVGTIAATRWDSLRWMQLNLIHFDKVSWLLWYVDVVALVWLLVYIIFSSDDLNFAPPARLFAVLWHRIIIYKAAYILRLVSIELLHGQLLIWHRDRLAA